MASALGSVGVQLVKPRWVYSSLSLELFPSMQDMTVGLGGGDLLMNHIWCPLCA